MSLLQSHVFGICLHCIIVPERWFKIGVARKIEFENTAKVPCRGSFIRVELIISPERWSEGKFTRKMVLKAKLKWPSV